MLVAIKPKSRKRSAIREFETEGVTFATKSDLPRGTKGKRPDGSILIVR
jgi:hypothetical protein